LWAVHLKFQVLPLSREVAATYEEVSIRQFEHGKQLISALNISNGERVLDIGAGTGRLAAYVAKIVGPSGRVSASGK
jgi:arsenite methyltransferase